MTRPDEPAEGAPTASVDLSGLRHRPALDRTGRRLGTVEQVFRDVETGEPRWVVVAGGPFGMARPLVPAAGMHRREEPGGPVLVLDADAGAVSGCPTIDPGDGLSAAEDRLLRRHYGVTTEVHTADISDW